MADLLTRLREERAKHKNTLMEDGNYCLECDEWAWPCLVSRALDCAIVLAEGADKWGLQAIIERAARAFDGGESNG